MADPNPSAPMAGGFIMAVILIGGTLTGAALGQSTIGFLAGFGIGAVVATAMWLRSRG